MVLSDINCSTVVKYQVKWWGFPQKFLGLFTVNYDYTSQTFLAYKVEESAPAGTVIGDLTFEDEDKDQTHAISLVDDNGGLFSVSSTGVVTKATDESLDPSRVYVIKAKVTDNGNPEKSVRKIKNF